MKRRTYRLTVRYAPLNGPSLPERVASDETPAATLGMDDEQLLYAAQEVVEEHEGVLFGFFDEHFVVRRIEVEEVLTTTVRGLGDPRQAAMTTQSHK